MASGLSGPPRRPTRASSACRGTIRFRSIAGVWPSRVASDPLDYGFSRGQQVLGISSVRHREGETREGIRHHRAHSAGERDRSGFLPVETTIVTSDTRTLRKYNNLQETVSL